MSKSFVVDASETRVTSVLHGERVVLSDDATSDEQVLGALGYKQEFKRDLSLWQSFSASFSILGLLPSIASTITYSLGYAGTAGTVWGWLIAATMIQCTAFSMAELCSSLPTAGGLYYAAAVLAPEGWGPFASWFVGWSNFLGFITGTCSLNYALAAMIITAAEIANPDYAGQNWHVYLVFLMLLIVGGLLAMQSTRAIGLFNVVGTVVNVAVVLIFVIWMPVGSINTPKTNDSQAVWTTFTNGTDWPIGWATVMGFVTTIYTMSGYDAPFHLSEECSNANIAGPRAIVATAQTGFYGGFAIILVIIYTVQDVSSVLSSQFGQPFGSLCLQVLGTRAGLAMFSINMVAQFFCCLGITIVASRIVFAYSRDGALIGSTLWSRVNTRTKTPVFAVWGVTLLSALLGLLLFAGPIVIGAVFTIGAIGQYTAFTAPIFLKLCFGNERFQPGPWNLGRLSKPINALACAWWLIITPALCFPAVRGADLTPTNMNWTCLLYGGTMFLALMYYALYARTWFKGPRINVEHVGTVASTIALEDNRSTSEKHGRA